MHMSWIGSVFVLEEMGSVFHNCIDCIYVNFGKIHYLPLKDGPTPINDYSTLGLWQKKYGWLEVIKLE